LYRHCHSKLALSPEESLVPPGITEKSALMLLNEFVVDQVSLGGGLDVVVLQATD
jgi:hypothetical protein